MIWADYINLIVSLLVIAISALQISSDDSADAFRGTTSELFKNRKMQGQELFLNRSMVVLGIIFIAFVIVSNALGNLGWRFPIE